MRTVTTAVAAAPADHARALAPPRAAPAPQPARQPAPAPGHELRWQAALRVGAVADPLEREADRVADALVAGLPPGGVSAGAAGTVRRSCACGGSGDECDCVRRTAVTGGAPDARPAPASVHAALRLPAAPLDTATRAAFEPRLGTDLSGVGVTVDPVSTAEVGALAYAAGDRIVFGPGQYAPHTGTGLRLLAHELTHVVQQRGGAPAAVRRQVPPGPAPAPPTPAQTPAQSPAQTPAPTQTPAQTPAPARAPATPPASTCSPAVDDMKKQAVQWLDDAATQLLTYLAELKIGQGGAAMTDPHIQRIAAVVDATFHTSDDLYVELLWSRLRHMSRSLDSGRVAITCGGSRCGGGTAGYADQTKPYALVMCNNVAVTDGAVGTMVHETAHTTLPQVGIRRQPGEGGILDRAYTTDRLYEQLTTEEALDNAESYEVLVHDLAKRTTTKPFQRTDTITGCDPKLVKNALARTGLRATDAGRLLEAVEDPVTEPTYTTSGLVADISAARRAVITKHFPAATTRADLAAIRAHFAMLEKTVSHNATVTCAATGPCATTGVLAAGAHGTVGATSVSVGATSVDVVKIQLCPGWATLPAEQQLRTFFAAFVLSRQPHDLGKLPLAATLTYVDFATEVSNDVTPAPLATDATTHLFRREPVP